MQATLIHFFLLLRRLGISLLLFTLCRILFFAFNRDLFPDVSAGNLFLILLAGLRFDISAIAVISSPFIILSLLPFSFRSMGAYQNMLKWVFFICNGAALSFNFIDTVYYRFTLKRSTFDIFNFIAAGDDTRRLIPLFITGYWYMIVLFILTIWLMVKLYQNTGRKQAKDGRYSFKETSIHLFLLALGCALALFGYRGGTQLIPITIASAAQYAPVNNVPLVLNTPFTLIKSYDQSTLHEKNYFSKKELKKLITPLHPGDTGSFRKLNVMVILMESFSNEFIGAISGGKTYAPFMDSLIRHSVLFDNAYANGKKSIEGIPAVLASIPALMNEAFITSVYAANSFNSLPQILKKKGYYSSFYHGATNGSMSFDDFCSAAGFDRYFGRTEYGNENDYDGSWGIWDEEFFLRVGDEMNKQPQPFFSALFTLTSHHPYTIPERYRQKFPEDGRPLHKSISYTDYALGKFFNAISKMPWFKNTLFVLTADHAGPPDNAFYSSRVGRYQVPVIFYLPSDTSFKGINHNVIQQIDIMPMILHFLHYDKPYFSLGKPFPVLPCACNQVNCAVNYLNNIYAVNNKEWTLHFDGEKAIGLYHFSNDSTLRKNLLYDPGCREIKNYLEQELKAIIQQYNGCLIRNEMIPGRGNE